MAKVKIQGHASGTGVLTVTAPNTSTDRTITLPDSTGTLLTADGDGSSLTGVGVAGITSSADATAMTIGSDERVAFKATTPKADLHLKAHNNGWTGSMLIEHNSGNKGWHIHPENNSENGLWFGYRADTTSAIGSESVATHLQLTSDGRGRSKFTAHAWGKISCQGTPSLITGHNVSSITDVSTGRYKANYTNNSSGANSVTVSGQNNSYYDEIYYVSIDQCDTTLASFGCSRSGTGAGWFDTYKMTFVTFAT
jgi:hypothetical protein